MFMLTDFDKSTSLTRQTVANIHGQDRCMTHDPFQPFCAVRTNL